MSPHLSVRIWRPTEPSALIFSPDMSIWLCRHVQKCMFNTILSIVSQETEEKAEEAEAFMIATGELASQAADKMAKIPLICYMGPRSLATRPVVSVSCGQKSRALPL
jgi:hypothetical protein